MKVEKPMQQEAYWKETLDLSGGDFIQIYRENISQVKDKKIAEFNLKVLHCILPCNDNLAKWKRKESKECCICGDVETIEHMIFKCKNVQVVWTDISNILGFTVELRHIVLGIEKNNAVSFILSLIAFLIYKHWLIKSLKNQSKVGILTLNMFKEELEYRSIIYHQVGWKDITKLINCALITI